jgi:hypothetical protein
MNPLKNTFTQESLYTRTYKILLETQKCCLVNITLYSYIVTRNISKTNKKKNTQIISRIFRRAPQQKLRTHRSLKAYCTTLWWKLRERWLVFFFIFPSNGAPVEWKWQAKTEVFGEKPVPVPLCSPQIPHGLTRDLTRASAVRGRRLTAWAMARPSIRLIKFRSQIIKIKR